MWQWLLIYANAICSRLSHSRATASGYVCLSCSPILFYASAIIPFAPPPLQLKGRYASRGGIATACIWQTGHFVVAWVTYHWAAEQLHTAGFFCCLTCFTSMHSALHLAPMGFVTLFAQTRHVFPTVILWRTSNFFTNLSLKHCLETHN